MLHEDTRQDSSRRLTGTIAVVGAAVLATWIAHGQQAINGNGSTSQVSGPLIARGYTEAPSGTVMIANDPNGGSVLTELRIKEGQTVKLRFVNQGEMDHEFVMDEEHAILEHKRVMEKHPDMEHDDPNAIRIAPGARGEIIWTFTNPGTFSFACLMPGHYEAGMHGPLEVDSAVANNP